MIDVRCICGRTYRVPDDKGGKKLQCRRCGSISRIPQPTRVADSDDEGGLVVPFQAPGISSVDDDDLRPLDAPPLDLRSPMRKCPSCGFNDEASVVICIRCGFDFRSGRRLEDAHEADERSSRHKVVRMAGDELDQLTKLAWTAMLTPLGVFLGPYVFMRGLSAERRLLAYGGDDRELQQAKTMRVMAGAGSLLWVVGGILGAVALSGQTEPDARDAVLCRQRLERVGSTLEAQLGPKPFGQDASFREGLRTMLEKEGLAPSELRCPLSNGLYTYRCREKEALTSETADNYIVLWDQEPHPDEQGRLSYPALRCDGSVELFRTRDDLEQALKRPAFADLVEGKTPGGGVGNPSPDGPVGRKTGPVAVRRREARFLELARKCDAIDPDLSAKLRVETDHFFDKVGVPPAQMLPVLLRREARDEVRRAAARMLARLALPRKARLDLARRYQRDSDLGVRYGMAHTLRQLGEQVWLKVMVDVLAEAPERLRLAAVRVVGKEASQGLDATRRVLLQAARLRRERRAQGDDPMFPLPTAAWEHLVPLLSDREVKREAVAVLYAAGRDGVRLVRSALGNADRDIRTGAFSVLDGLRLQGVIPLEEFLELVGEELDHEVQAAALESLSQDHEPPEPYLLQWVLDVLRGEAKGDGVRRSCQKILARVGRDATKVQGEQQLKLLLKDLNRRGDHEAVLSELAASGRILDERLDRAIEAAWGSVKDPLLRRRLLKVLLPRPQETALQVILGAVDDSDTEVRVAALDALDKTRVPLSDKFRREVARELGKRLKRERDPGARQIVLKLSRGERFCSRFEPEGTAEHVCSAPLVRSLQSRAKQEDRAALSVLATHPTQSVVAGLLDLLSSARTSYKPDVLGALRAVTGLGLTTMDIDPWRKEISRLSDRIKAHHERRAYEQRRFRNNQLKLGQQYLDNLKRR